MREEAEAGNIEDVTKQEELVATIDERTFLSVAALKILPYIATFSSEADQMLTDAEPAVKRLYDAYKNANELRKRDLEDDIEHCKRVML